MENDFAGLSKEERKIISHFSAIEKSTVTKRDVSILYPDKASSANQILSRLAKKGWLQRAKRGVYTIVPISSRTSTPAIENSWLMAMDLFKPAFISGWSAAEHWDLTEQIFNTVSVATLQPQRETNQLFNNIQFRVRTIDNSQYFGTKNVWFGSKAIEIADPSRTIIDVLDLPRFGGGGRHTVDVVKNYWRSEMRDPELLLQYAIRYNRGSVFKRLGYLAEALNAPVTKEWLETCRTHISKGITNLDPDGPKTGEIVSRWNLKVNIPLPNDN